MQARFTTSQYTYGQQAKRVKSAGLVLSLVGVFDPAVYAYEALGVTLASTGTLFQSSWGPANPMYPNSGGRFLTFYR